MAIAYRTSSTGGNSSGKDLTIDKPSGTLDNDIMVVVLYSEASSTAFGLPANWAWWGGPTGQVNNTNNAWGFTAWKRASSEGANYTFTHSTSAWRVGVISSFSGVVTTGDPIDGGPTGNKGASVSTGTASSITPTSENTMAIASMGNYDGRTTLVGSSGYSLGADLGGCANWYNATASSGATGNKYFAWSGVELSGANWWTWHQAIKLPSATTLRKIMRAAILGP